MEGKTNNTGLVVALVIFIMISLGLGVFIGYDKLINNKSENNNNQETEVNDSIEPETNIKTDSYQVLELSPIGGLAVMYNGEVYVNINDSTQTIDYLYGNGKFQTLVNTRNNYQEYSFGNLTVTSKYVNYGGLNKWLKLNISNVKSIHNNEYGQEIDTINPRYGIVMVNSDSSVSYIEIDDLIDGNINPTKLDVTGVSNVVTEDRGGYITYFVKEDGTKTDVNTLIK